MTPATASEIDPRAAGAFMAGFSAGHGTTAAARARQLAASLIRCMDSRDVTGADAILARVRGRDLDAVADWVWRIEADRAARRRVYRASAAWRSGRKVTGLAACEDSADLVAERRAALHKPAPRRVLEPCGTYGAFRRHEDHGELIDGDCWKAARAYWREAKRRHRAAAAEELAEAA